eukprot:TRINITY_DN2158_c0_g1_i1.p1 TRINITY_DN2158_c0_g1~~TRINITY_DN2158_c0_g1_i1.p1  ORF type:complete len:421 (+),score=94.12 TRINITY_DN2158_c0_g1_i1:25-1263(+)
MQTLQLLLVITALTACLAERVRYDGHRVLRVHADQEHVDALEKMGLDIWRRGSKASGSDVRVGPQQSAEVEGLLRSRGVEYSVMIGDVQALIDAENVVVNSSTANDSFYSSYHNYEETYAWMATLPQKYPSLASLVTIGKTYQGRTLQAIKISKGNPKAAIWLDGLIHAREWIAGAVVNYIAGSLLDQYGKSDDTTALVDGIDWYILPIFNADGVEYTHTADRMWRKTRTPNTGSACIGTDPNRNWAFHWDGCGTSNDPCSDSYSGPRAFSEPCVKSVTDWLYDQQQKTKLFKGYINFHSYSQLWMTPWGWTTALPTDYAEQNRVAGLAVDALKAVHGTVFDHGSIANIIYCASGSSADWTYGNLTIEYSYGVELRDKGEFGFLLPAREIIPSGEETLAAVKVMGKEILAKL